MSGLALVWFAFICLNNKKKPKKQGKLKKKERIEKNLLLRDKLKNFALYFNLFKKELIGFNIT